jgi:ferritin-like metal-binding protein YciE
MPTRDIDEQLNKYLTDAHSIEVQAIAQLRSAPDIAGSPELAAMFADHLRESEEHERLVAQRLEARGAKPSRTKDAVMAAGGKGFVLFAASQPDTPGKLLAHAHSYEYLERAAYELLGRVADRAQDHETVAVARRIGEEERAMAERLAGAFGLAAAASLEAKGAEDLDEHLVKYLTDAHALESQAAQLLQRAVKVGGDPELERLYEQHLQESGEHARLVAQRLEAHGASPSKLQDAAMRAGALNWGAFFQAQPDTPGKLAAFSYAFEGLEIAGYELLRRVAERAGDAETAATVDRILADERSMAERVAGRFTSAVEASLAVQGVAA